MTTKSHQQLDVPQLVKEAIERCQEYLSPTPLEYSLYLSKKIIDLKVFKQIIR